MLQTIPAVSIADQTLIGNANALGVMDRGGDVIAPGAFSKAIRGFLRDGFIGLAHDWDALPVAMPKAASEVDGFLRIAAVFHSTPAAQAARTVLLERMTEGLRVGLSVGFRVGKSQEFPSGAALLKASNGLLSLDKSSISGWKGPCRLVNEVAELFEVSIVSVPMNPQSHVMSVKDLKEEVIRAQMQLGWARISA